MTKRQRKTALKKAAPRWFTDSRCAEKLLEELAKHEGFKHITGARDELVKQEKCKRAQANCLMVSLGLATLEDRIANLIRARQQIGQLYYGRPIRKTDRWIHREQRSLTIHDLPQVRP